MRNDDKLAHPALFLTQPISSLLWPHRWRIKAAIFFRPPKCPHYCRHSSDFSSTSIDSFVERPTTPPAVLPRHWAPVQNFYAPTFEAIKDNNFIQTSGINKRLTMDSRNDNLSQAPTAATTPIFPASEGIKKDDASTERKGAVLTATNTIDTLTLAGDQQDQKIDQESSDGNPDLSKVSTTRKLLLLSMFTLAEFLDAFNNSALFPAIPTLTSQLNFTANEVVWIISAYQLTFAAFLLVVSLLTHLVLLIAFLIVLLFRAVAFPMSTPQNRHSLLVPSCSVSPTSSVASPIKRSLSSCSEHLVVSEVP
jgi:hypothetical protein